MEQVDVAVNDVAADCISQITLVLQMLLLLQAKATSLMLLRLTWCQSFLVANHWIEGRGLTKDLSGESHVDGKCGVLHFK